MKEEVAGTGKVSFKYWAHTADSPTDVPLSPINPGAAAVAKGISVANGQLYWVDGGLGQVRLRMRVGLES